MYDKIEEKAVILPPFKHFIMTVGEIPTSYLETMTYYEMLVWFIEYLRLLVHVQLINGSFPLYK